MNRTTAIALLCTAALACDTTKTLHLVPLEPQAPASAPAGSSMTLGFRVEDGDGKTVNRTALHAEVLLGGGSLDQADAVTAASSGATFRWTLGPAPVPNRLRVSIGEEALIVDVQVTLEVPYPPEAFGDVNAFLAGQGIDGSTEDLAFTPDGSRLVLGVPGGLVSLDPQGNATMMPTSGETPGWPLGIAYDREGTLWAADATNLSLIKVAPDGAVSTVLAEAGSGPFEGPNYVGVGPNGFVYLSDPCIGCATAPAGRRSSRSRRAASAAGPRAWGCHTPP